MLPTLGDILKGITIGQRTRKRVKRKVRIVRKRKSRRATMTKAIRNRPGYGKGRTVKVAKRRTGKIKSVKRDRARKAKKPGWRRTKWGTRYYEARRNRSDVQKV